MSVNYCVKKGRLFCIRNVLKKSKSKSKWIICFTCTDLDAGSGFISRKLVFLDMKKYADAYHGYRSIGS
jgi:hypothetical protein